jgi:hypothetical protein
MAKNAIQRTFAPWVAQAPQAPANLEVTLRPEDVIASVWNGLQRVAASLNSMPREVRSLPDDSLKRVLKERGLGRTVAIGLEIPFAGLTVKERNDYVFHPNRFNTRRLRNYIRLEITPTVDFLNAVMLGSHLPEGVEPTTENMKSCLSVWIARYTFHTLAHQHQEITAGNRQDHAGPSRLHADFEADLESLIHLVHAFGLEPSASNSPPSSDVVTLMKQLDCCSAFAVRQNLRGPATPKEVGDRKARSIAGRISMKLVLNNVVPLSVIVGGTTASTVPVIVNNCFHHVVSGHAAGDRDDIANVILYEYRNHLTGCNRCRTLATAHVQAVIDSLGNI